MNTKNEKPVYRATDTADKGVTYIVQSLFCSANIEKEINCRVNKSLVLLYSNSVGRLK